MKALLNCILLGGLLALSACGKDGGGSAATAPATAVVTANGCAADQIPTQAGCGVYSPQCGYGQGLVGTTCQPAIAQTNCTTVAAGQIPGYGCSGYNNGYYNGGAYNNGYYNGGYYNGSSYYNPGYTTGGVYYYNSQTQTFNTNSMYYSQPVYGQYGYGYRPYYPKRSGLFVTGQVTLGF